MVLNYIDIISLGGDRMLDIALKLLKEITSHSYKAYIVGGFVRDHILGINSNSSSSTLFLGFFK